MENQDEKVIVEESQKTEEEKDTKKQSMPLSASNLPVPSAQNKAIGVITILYILFVIVLSAALIALSIFVFTKVWGWIRG